MLLEADAGEKKVECGRLRLAGLLRLTPLNYPS
jgi:hypothetical protein